MSCEHNKPVFDGTRTLTFARVNDSVGSKVFLHPVYPRKCPASRQAECSGSKYVVAGDVVAVGDNCNGWTYVQFIRKTRVTYGWVSSAALTRTRIVGAGLPTPGEQRYHFSPTRDADFPVCEAYLQRLNLTEFSSPAYCGHPENDSAPGFQILKREPIAPGKEIPLSGVLYQRWYRPNPYLTANWDFSADLIEAWRYSTPVDLGNDGHPERVIVWQGGGLGEGLVRCGTGYLERWGYRARQLPLVMDGDDHIDERATAAIFRGRGSPAWVAGKSWVPKDASFPFRPIGHSIGIFEYRGTIYFDTFFDASGDANAERAGEAKLANVLGVFVRRDGATREQCEYRMAGHDYPPVDAGE